MKELIPDTWARLLNVELTAPYFRELEAFVAHERATNEVFPPPDEVFAAFTAAPPERVRVVLLGQDPYPNPGQGHGLCFSVKPGVKLPASLRNIFRERESDLGIPPSKNGCFTPWAAQGVLLLNSVLTVRSGQAASHAGKGWEKFTDAVLKCVNDFPRRIVFILWGAYAQKKAAFLDEKRHTILKSAHPSPLAASGGFFGSKPFSQTNAALTEAGETPIDWRLPD